MQKPAVVLRASFFCCVYLPLLLLLNCCCCWCCSCSVASAGACDFQNVRVPGCWAWQSQIFDRGTTFPTLNATYRLSCYLMAGHWKSGQFGLFRQPWGCSKATSWTSLMFILASLMDEVAESRVFCLSTTKTFQFPAWWHGPLRPPPKAQNRDPIVLMMLLIMRSLCNSDALATIR